MENPVHSIADNSCHISGTDCVRIYILYWVVVISIHIASGSTPSSSLEQSRKHTEYPVHVDGHAGTDWKYNYQY